MLVSVEDLKRKYPISDLLDGWYFRYSEVSNNHYLVEGKDIQNRSVSCEGYDVDSLLKKAADMENAMGSN